MKFINAGVSFFGFVGSTVFDMFFSLSVTVKLLSFMMNFVSSMDFLGGMSLL